MGQILLCETCVNLKKLRDHPWAYFGLTPMQIRVGKFGGLCIRLLFVQDTLLQAVHFLSANILVVTQGGEFNMKWMTKISDT